MRQPHSSRHLTGAKRGIFHAMRALLRLRRMFGRGAEADSVHVYVLRKAPFVVNGWSEEP